MVPAPEQTVDAPDSECRCPASIEELAARASEG